MVFFSSLQLSLVSPAERARSSVSSLLSDDNFPENPILLELDSRLQQLLSHSVWDGERSFQMALEEALARAHDWNTRSPARYLFVC